MRSESQSSIIFDHQAYTQVSGLSESVRRYGSRQGLGTTSPSERPEIVCNRVAGRSRAHARIEGYWFPSEWLERRKGEVGDWKWRNISIIAVSYIDSYGTPLVIG